MSTDAMTTDPASGEASRLAHTSAATVQTYARIGGILGLISVVAGGFGEAALGRRLTGNP